MVCLVRAGSIGDWLRALGELALAADVPQWVSCRAAAGYAGGFSAPPIVRKHDADRWVIFEAPGFDLRKLLGFLEMCFIDL